MNFQSELSDIIMIEKPAVKWSDVAGLEMAKKLLKQAVIMGTGGSEMFEGLYKWIIMSRKEQELKGLRILYIRT